MAAGILTPFATVQQAVKLALLPDESNCIKRPAPAVRNRIARLCDNVSVPDFKKACKKVRCTFNEALQSILGCSVKEYCDRRGDAETTSFMMASSFTLENFPESPETIKLGNNWVPQYLRIPVSHNFDSNLVHNKAQLRSLIGSVALLGMQNMIACLLLMPFNIAKQSFTILSRKLTMVYSNMPGPS